MASRPGPFAGKPAPTRGLRPTTDLCPPPIRCRRGFTREYASGDNGERRVVNGQQARPFRG
ncbi:diguanylate phosphodiesterase [Pseudomonas hunanensis]|uniref:Diguanylate phosphodiesterase n=1 Tax=Pseudomonas hunanensis TaxID=1247546 RepID=A0ABD6MSQ6_9PSED|nr:diguanylate phosphodiesterase [Pseudomonas hunanensis]